MKKIIYSELRKVGDKAKMKKVVLYKQTETRNFHCIEKTYKNLGHWETDKAGKESEYIESCDKIKCKEK